MHRSFLLAMAGEINLTCGSDYPLDVSWAGNFSGLEVGTLGKIAQKARYFFNIMLVFSNLQYTLGMSP